MRGSLPVAAAVSRAFAEGRKLQLPLYALAAQETLRLGVVADGFYWHFVQGETTAGIFVGLWVPSIHSLGSLLLSPVEAPATRTLEEVVS